MQDDSIKTFSTLSVMSESLNWMVISFRLARYWILLSILLFRVIFYKHPDNDSQVLLFVFFIAIVPHIRNILDVYDIQAIEDGFTYCPVHWP